jgi:hypothetical protein
MFLVAEAGKICCNWKPLAPSYEDCKIIQEAFDSKDIPLLIIDEVCLFWKKSG